MKLSTMTTDQAADALLLIAPEIETLMNDDELISKFQNRKTSGDKTEAAKFGMATILGIASYLLKVHRETTWNILGALNQKTPHQVGKQLLPVTIGQISETLNDKELLSFFTPSEALAQEPQSDT